METTGAVVYLHSLVRKAIANGYGEELNDKLTGFLTGSKIWEDIGGAIHVNDMLREVETVIPGYFTQHYAMLSEFAHPNWSGTFGAFGITFEDDLVVKFARGGRGPDTRNGLIVGRLAGSVGMFTGYYNALADMLLPFTQAVEAFHATNAKKN